MGENARRKRIRLFQTCRKTPLLSASGIRFNYVYAPIGRTEKKKNLYVTQFQHSLALICSPINVLVSTSFCKGGFYFHSPISPFSTLLRRLSVWPRKISVRQLKHYKNEVVSRSYRGTFIFRFGISIFLMQNLMLEWDGFKWLEVTTL